AGGPAQGFTLGRRLRRVLPERGDRLLRRAGRVGQREYLGGQVAGVAGLAQGGDDRGEVGVAEPGGPAVRVGEVDVPDEPRRPAEGVGEVRLLDVHVVQVG